MKPIRQNGLKPKPDVRGADDGGKSEKITQGRYVAEILQSRNAAATETFWYYVLHRDGLSKVIDLRKFSTYDEAAESDDVTGAHEPRCQCGGIEPRKHFPRGIES